MGEDLSLSIDGDTHQNDQRGATQALQSLHIECLLGVNRQDSNDTNCDGTYDDEAIESLVKSKK
jgi:hypothetical protein